MLLALPHVLLPPPFHVGEQTWHFASTPEPLLKALAGCRPGMYSHPASHLEHVGQRGLHDDDLRHRDANHDGQEDGALVHALEEVQLQADAAGHKGVHDLQRMMVVMVVRVGCEREGLKCKSRWLSTGLYPPPWPCTQRPKQPKN